MKSDEPSIRGSVQMQWCMPRQLAEMPVSRQELQSVLHGVLRNEQIGNPDAIDTMAQANDLQPDDFIPIGKQGFAFKVP